MAKTVIREIIIILLLCLAIMLLLGILLYEYVPITKTIPNPVSYTTPDDVKQELANAGDIDESSIIMTYEVDETDLNNYKRIQNYKPGKANPFSSYETAATTSENGTNTTNSNGSTSETSNSETSSQNATSNNNSNNNNSNNATTSGGQFFQDKGTK